MKSLPEIVKSNQAASTRRSMKITIIDWRNVRGKLKEASYTVNEPFEGSFNNVLIIVDDIYNNLGLNVMITHRDENDIQINVDDRHFQQRG